MKHLTLINNLKSIGFKENYSKALISLLKLKSATVHDISNDINIPRSSTEIILRNLCKQGYANSLKKKNILFFNSIEPEEILNIIKEKNSIIEKSIPLMQEIYKDMKSFNSINLYEGDKNMKNILKKVLNEANEVLYFGSPESLFFSTTKKIMDDFIKERVKRKIPIRVIFQESEFAKQRTAIKDKLLMRAISINTKPICDGTLMIWKDKMIMLSNNTKINILLIENKQLVDLQRSMFERIWEENYC